MPSESHIFRTGICPRRVEVSKTGGEKFIDHLLDLLNIKRPVVEFRKPHQTEAQLFDLLSQNIRRLPKKILLGNIILTSTPLEVNQKYFSAINRRTA